MVRGVEGGRPTPPPFAWGVKGGRRCPFLDPNLKLKSSQFAYSVSKCLFRHQVCPYQLIICPLPLPYVLALCPCPLPMPSAHAICPCPLPMPSAHAPCPCPLPMPSVHALCPCPLSMSSVHVLCPCSLSMLSVHAFCLCLLSMPPCLLPV